MKSRNKKLSAIAISIAALTFSSVATSSVGELFDQMGMVTSTSADSFKGQTMRHYVGGSASFRVPQKTYQLMAFSPPDLNVAAGCGGIDLYGGSFSFINDDQLVQALQNIGNNAAGAIFKLAIDSVSPQLGGVMDYMNDLAQKINALNVNSCQAAEGLVEASANVVRGKTTDNYITQYGSRFSGLWEDVSAARQNISSNINARKSAREAAKSDPVMGDKLKSVNVTWEALKNTRFNANEQLDEKDARLMLTLFGAVICANKTNPSDPDTPDRVCHFQKPSQDNFFNFLAGENFTLVASGCRFSGTDVQTSCLYGAYNTTENYAYEVQGVTFNNFKGYIRGEMDFLRESVVSRGYTSGTDLDNARLKRAFGLINMSRVPAWSLIKLSSMDSVGSSFYDQAADAIAADIAYNYINSQADAVRQGVYQERRNQKYIANEDDKQRLDEQLEHLDEVVEWFDSYRQEAQKSFAELGQISATINALSSSFEHRMAQIARR